jgi:uncharacterized protein with HEPN domain
MSKREARLYLEDIQLAICRIEEYTAPLTFEEFARDTKTIDAVVRNLSIIGEAVKNIPEEIRLTHPGVPWEEIIGMRNKVIHEYFGVDEDILWKTIKTDLPLLKESIAGLSSKQS